MWQIVLKSLNATITKSDLDNASQDAMLNL
jgi:hypothetical protein